MITTHIQCIMNTITYFIKLFTMKFLTSIMETYQILSFVFSAVIFHEVQEIPDIQYDTPYMSYLYG